MKKLNLIPSEFIKNLDIEELLEIKKYCYV